MPEPTPLRTLLTTLPQCGRVEWIGVRPARGQAMKALNSVNVGPGNGLEGDRFNAMRGHGGITTRVVEGGELALGDNVETCL